MRTTLTIDDDIAMKLKTEAKKETDKSFKEVVNETLRLGLLARQKAQKPTEFRVNSRSLGIRKGLNYDNIGELLEQIEEPER